MSHWRTLSAWLSLGKLCLHRAFFCFTRRRDHNAARTSIQQSLNTRAHASVVSKLSLLGELVSPSAVALASALRPAEWGARGGPLCRAWAEVWSSKWCRVLPTVSAEEPEFSWQNTSFWHWPFLRPSLTPFLADTFSRLTKHFVLTLTFSKTVADTFSLTPFLATPFLVCRAPSPHLKQPINNSGIIEQEISEETKIRRARSVSAWRSQWNERDGFSSHERLFLQSRTFLARPAKLALICVY